MSVSQTESAAPQPKGIGDPLASSFDNGAVVVESAAPQPKGIGDRTRPPPALKDPPLRESAAPQPKGIGDQHPS